MINKKMSVEELLDQLIDEVQAMSDEERFKRIEEKGGFTFSNYEKKG